MFGIIINDKGFKVEFVHILEDGNIDSYILKDAEKLIAEQWNIANAMNKPKWDGTKWIETEPLPEPEPTIQPPNLEDRVSVTEETLLTLMELQMMGGM